MAWLTPRTSAATATFDSDHRQWCRKSGLEISSPVNSSLLSNFENPVESFSLRDESTFSGRWAWINPAFQHLPRGNGGRDVNLRYRPH